MKKFLLISLLLAFFTINVTAVNCTYSKGNIRYNLTGLMVTNGDEYGGYDQGSQYYYRMNVCLPTQSSLSCKKDKHTICQYDRNTNQLVAKLGHIESPWSVVSNPYWLLLNESEPTMGVQYVFTNGDLCWIQGKPQVRTVIVQFPCTYTRKYNVTITEESDCVFKFILPSRFGCATF
jgi:hypothetical protein